MLTAECFQMNTFLLFHSNTLLRIVYRYGLGFISLYAVFINFIELDFFYEYMTLFLF